MAPQAAFYQLQTCKTLYVRVQQQAASALAVAAFLERHPKVAWVRYPGLASHPQKALADRQHATGCHGTMLACELKGGVAAGRALMDGVQVRQG
jgi:O-acetylhomoserine/O-acetylserine sulfhydrylase-like pyridoxal-dependent enzyme